jgi:hypothetical protein
MKRVGDDVWGDTGPRAVPAWDNSPYENFASGDCQGSKYAALDALRKLAPPEKVTEALVAASKSKNRDVQIWALKQLVPAEEKP